MKKRAWISRGGLTKKHCNLYHVWKAMIYRCHRRRDGGYRYYGGRGIRVCKRWRESFAAFLGDMGERPTPRHSLERKDTNGNYEPSNCRWATRKEQARNTRRNLLVEINGQTKTLAEWAETSKVSYATLHRRIKSGWSPALAIAAIRPKDGWQDGSPAKHWGSHNNNCRSHFLELDGERLTVSEWSRRHGNSVALILNRLSSGWTICDAVKSLPRPPKMLTIDGVTLSQAEWCRRSGLSESLVSTRLRRGWSVYLAIKTPA